MDTKGVFLKIAFCTAALNVFTLVEGIGDAGNRESPDGLRTLVRERIADLATREKGINQEKEKLQLVAKDLQSVFANEKSEQGKSQSFLKRLQNMGGDDKAASLRKDCYEKRRAGIVKAVVVGGLVAVVGIALGLLIGKSVSRKSTCESEDLRFARWFTNAVEKNV